MLSTNLISLPFYYCDQWDAIDTDAFVPQGNRKQRLSIFAKEIDVLVDITVGHMGKAASLLLHHSFLISSSAVTVILFFSLFQQGNVKLY